MELYVNPVLNFQNFSEKNADGYFTLNKKDAYYAEIQLGLVLVNLSNYGFVIYNSLEHNCIDKNIKLDVQYCKTLL